MIQFNVPVYLASQSPRRKKLLEQINLKFECFSVDLNEEIFPGEIPEKAVLRLAVEKMNAAEKMKNEGIIITADTIVVLSGRIIGKPEDKNDAFKLLTGLSGNTHKVLTGFMIKNLSTGQSVIDYETTEVTFRLLDEQEIRDYIETGSPMDKAGAYGIQDDFGAVFVEKISGCYYNVVGLPLAKVYKKLMEFK